MVRGLRESGVTIILTTHYIDEAEEMADRIGVINKGEIILVEDKAELMRKLGSKELTLQLHKKLDAVPAALAAHDLELSRGRPRTGLLLRHARRAHGHHLASSTISGPRGSPSATSTPRRARSRRFSSAWCGEAAMNFRADRHDLHERDGAHAPHAPAERRRAGHHDVALFRRLRIGDRLAHPRGRRRELRRLHRARADHALAADAVDLQRVGRHLLPEIHRDDLRASLRAGLLSGDRHQLRRRGGDEIRRSSG